MPVDGGAPPCSRAARDSEAELKGVVRPRFGWALTGSGHFFKESLEIMRTLPNLDVFVSKAAAEVIRMYKQDLELGPDVRLFKDTKEVRAGQLWRLFTPTFIQLDPMHILFNVLLLANLGGVVERRYGWHRLMIFVLAVSAISNVCEYRFVSPLFGGLSGVVFGLFGFVWTESKYNPNSDFVVPPMVTAMMLGWFVFCIVGLGGTVANFVHWGGLASGALIGRLAARLARSS